MNSIACTSNQCEEQRPVTYAQSSIVTLATILILSAAAAGCDTGSADTLFDPNRHFDPDPVVTAIEPPPPWLAGIGTLTIIGENFSPEPSRNIVFFDDRRATVIDATATSLTVRTPNLARSGINVRVTVVGAEGISNSVSYSLEPAIHSIGGITDFEEVFGIATDSEDNVYMSLFASNVSAGIKRLTPDGERQDYAASTFKWDALDFDGDGFLYGVRNVRAIFRFPPGGGNAENWAVADDAAARFRALDVDAAGNVWVGGGGGNIYRVTPAGEFTPFEAGSSVNAIKAVGGSLYLGEDGPPHRVVRRSIEVDGSLGAPEMLFTAPAGVQVLSLALTAAGEVLVGTTAPDPIFLVELDGSSQVLYPDLLQPSASDLAWGSGPMLFVVQGRTSNTSPSLYRLNTQREGAD